MYKRFLAILAIVTTVFAFGVGSAMADKPDGAGPPDPHPGCENGKDNGCEDGIPGDGEDEGEDGGEPGPQDLCDAIRGLDENLAPVAEACDAVVAALTGGGAEEPPSEEPPAEDPPAEDPPAEDPPAEEPGLQDLCDGLREGGAPGELADGCDQVVAGIEGGEDPPAEEPPAEEPPAEEPPAEEPPAEDPPSEEPPAEEPGLQDLCDGLREGGAPGELADGCDQLVAALPAA